MAASAQVSVASGSESPAEPTGEVQARVAFRYTDRDITESSGLVARDGLMFTVNDSGDDPVVYVVEPDSGGTVGVTTYSEDNVSDVEALAPGRPGTLWVGDIGDNNRDRQRIDVYRVPIARPTGDREVEAGRFGLAYPDGPHDAEALLVHPVTGRVYVVSKAITGGVVYAAPRSLHAETVNRLAAVGAVPGLVTDGAFFPDGRHVLLRSYGGAAVFTFPGLRQVGRFELPAQEQGEAVAIDESSRVYVGTEGVYTEVLQILLPPAVRSAMGDDVPSELPSAPPAGQAPDPTSRRLIADEGDGVWIAGGVLLVTLAGWVYFTVSRRRSPRRQ